MTNTTTDRELADAELAQVSGGDTALQHEATHADLPNNGIQFGGGRTPVAIIAILIGWLMTTNNIERELSRSNELRDDDLEQVVGGRANFDDIKIVKHVDKATTWGDYRIGKPPAACKAGGSQGQVQTSWAGPGVSVTLAVGGFVTALLFSQALVTVAAATSPYGKPCGPYGGYAEWWFWPRRHH